MRDLKLEEIVKMMKEQEIAGEGRKISNLNAFKIIYKVVFTSEALKTAKERVKKGDLYGRYHLVLRKRCLKHIIFYEIEEIKANSNN